MNKPKPMPFTPANYAASCLPAAAPGHKCQTRRLIKAAVPCDGPELPTVSALAAELERGRYCRWKPGDVFYWSNEPIVICELIQYDDARAARFGVAGEVWFVRNDKEVTHTVVPARTKFPAKTGKRWPGRVLPVEWARPERWRVTAVRAHQLVYTSKADASAEGITMVDRGGANGFVYPGHYPAFWEPVAAYRAQWTALHGKWDSDAFVWAITYERIA